MKWKISCSSISTQGNRQENQDSLVIWNKIINNENFAVFAVADGIGGLEKGEIASSIVCNEINFFAKRLCYLLEDNQAINIKDELETLVYAANKHIISYGRRNNITLGTTLTMVLVYRDEVYLCHVGDSVCCIFQEGIVSLLSETHAAYHDRKELTSCLGFFENLKVKQINKISIESQTSTLLLGSDGIFNCLNLSESIETIEKYDMKNALENITDQIRSAGETDNATAIMVKLVKFDEK